MTCKPDRRLLAGALAPLAFWLALSGPLAAAPGEDSIALALAALERDDGVGAEVAGKRALEEGASRRQVAALIGEAEFLQGDLQDARQWLEGGNFDRATEARGLHALARLELAEEDFPAAAATFDRILSRGHATGAVWVDIGRMRYRAGEHQLAVEAAYQAVEIAPQDPRALEFLAEIVRDSQGLREALPILREAMEVAPEDIGLIAQYAATLGDAGEHRQSLRVARQLLKKDGSATIGFYLQAVLAARAGEDDLARRLWWRTNGDFDATPAGLTMSAVLEFRAGNYALAVEHFDDLRRIQPFNQTAQVLFARALVANDEANVALDYLLPLAQRRDASNYVLMLTARAYEQRGDRELAAQYLDRAARMTPLEPEPVPAFLMRDSYGNPRNRDHPSVRLRNMLSEARFAEARALSGELLEQFPGSVDILSLAGDVELMAGNDQAALRHFREAAQVRSNWSLVRRMAFAMERMGDEEGARRLLANYLAFNPRVPAASAMLARLQRSAANPARAALLFRHASGIGSGRSDPLLLTELMEMEAAVGHESDALATALRAEALQRGNYRVARVLARGIQIGGGDAAIAQVLLAKAGGRGVTAEARP